MKFKVRRRLLSSVYSLWPEVQAVQAPGGAKNTLFDDVIKQFHKHCRADLEKDFNLDRNDVCLSIRNRLNFRKSITQVIKHGPYVR